MTSSISYYARRVRIVVCSIVLLLLVTTLQAQQILVANYSGNVAAYTSSGVTLNPSLISGLQSPIALAYANGYIYTASIGFGDPRAVIGKYTLSGTPVSTSLLSGPPKYFPSALALDENDHLYVALADGSVWAYNTSGTPIYSSPLFGLLGHPGGMVFGPNGHLYATAYDRITEFTTGGQLVNEWSFPTLGAAGGLVVENGYIYAVGQTGQISQFTTTGAIVNLNLVTGLPSPWGLTSDGKGHLFVADSYENRIAQYTTSGATVNATFITDGLSNPMAVLVVPEPLSLSLVALGAGLIWQRRRHRDLGVSRRTPITANQPRYASINLIARLFSERLR